MRYIIYYIISMSRRTGKALEFQSWDDVYLLKVLEMYKSIWVKTRYAWCKTTHKKKKTVQIIGATNIIFYLFFDPWKKEMSFPHRRLFQFDFFTAPNFKFHNNKKKKTKNCNERTSLWISECNKEWEMRIQTQLRRKWWDKVTAPWKSYHKRTCSKLYINSHQPPKHYDCNVIKEKTKKNADD